MSVIYGDTLYQTNNSQANDISNKQNLFKITNRSNPKYRMPFCHQSVFVKTSLLKERPFDLCFKICADNDFFTEMYHKNHKFYKVNQIISVYSLDGISSKNFFRLQFENFKVAQKYNKFYVVIYSPKIIYSLLKYLAKYLSQKLLCKKIRNKTL